jgi:hypothetical protein
MYNILSFDQAPAKDEEPHGAKRRARRQSRDGAQFQFPQLTSSFFFS